MKEKEKRMVACVVLGASLVSLITVLVAAFVESLDCLDKNNSEFLKIAGGLMLVAVLLGAAFVTVFFVNKKKCFAVNLGLAIAIVAYGAISTIALGCYGRRYSAFDSYLAMALTLIVSTALMFAAWLYLTRTKQTEEPEKNEPETDE